MAAAAHPAVEPHRASGGKGRRRAIALGIGPPGARGTREIASALPLSPPPPVCLCGCGRPSDGLWVMGTAFLGLWSLVHCLTGACAGGGPTACARGLSWRTGTALASPRPRASACHWVLRRTGACVHTQHPQQVGDDRPVLHRCAPLNGTSRAAGVRHPSTAVVPARPLAALGCLQAGLRSSVGGMRSTDGGWRSTDGGWPMASSYSALWGGTSALEGGGFLRILPPPPPPPCVRRYFPGNMCLYVVGNVNPKRTAARIERIFGGVPPKYGVRAPVHPLGQNAETFNALVLTPPDPLAFGLPVLDHYPPAARALYRAGVPVRPTQTGWTLPVRPVVRYAELGPPPEQPELKNDVLQVRVRGRRGWDGVAGRG